MIINDIGISDDLDLSNYILFLNSLDLNINFIEAIGIRDCSADNGKDWIGIESIICLSETQGIYEIDIRFAWSSQIFKQHLYDYGFDRLESVDRIHRKLILYLCAETTISLQDTIQHHLVPDEFIIGNYWKSVEHVYISLPYPHPFQLPDLPQVDLKRDLGLDNISPRSIMLEGGLRTRGIIKTGNPLISVITVVYNGEKRLEQTIQSVINQNCDNFEYIIVDGGSDDRTLEIIKKYDSHIDYWVSAKDRGIYDAMNKGINLANGQWLSFMNCEDLFFDRQSLNSIPLAAEVDFYYSDSIIYYDNKRTKLCICSVKTKVFIHQAIVYKKDTHDNGNYLVHDRLIVSDYLFFRQNDRKQWVKLDRPLSIYSMEGLSSTSSRHYVQKIFIDLISGDLSELKMSYLIIVKNIKDWIKLIIRWKG
jgi:Glycosyl transferase family 2